jgi:hypothetical protein
MTTSSVPIRHAAVSQHLHDTFVGSVLPRVETHGRVYFRHVRCQHHKAEFLAEMAALSWRWFVRLVRRGKDVLKFVGSLAIYAARAISSGRRVCRQPASRKCAGSSTPTGMRSAAS